MDQTGYIIELKPEPSDVPGIIRLRKALKVLLRQHGLRAVSVREVAEGSGNHGDEPGAPGTTGNPPPSPHGARRRGGEG